MQNAGHVIDVVETVVGLETSYPLLLTLLRLKEDGVELSAECCQVVGRALVIELTQVVDVARWVDSLCLDQEGWLIHRCVSISCTSNGAQKLWTLIEPEMARLGLSSKIHPVHCLARCGSGPCLGLEEQIYLGVSESIQLDDRPWREAPVDQEL